MNLNENTNDQFKLVFVQYYNKLCNYAYSIVKDFDSSEDVVQEVFIKIWENRQDLITSEEIRFYLFASVRNNCLTYLKKNKKNILVPISDQDGREDPVTSLQEQEPAINYKELLNQAIQQLPPKCKEVFLLSRISKQSYKEIADQLGISIKTVENQIGKALQILRRFAKRQ